MILMIAVTIAFAYIKSIVSDLTLSLTSSPSPTITIVSTGAAPAGIEMDSTVFAALIGLAGIVLGALMTGGLTLYQLHRSDKQAKALLHLQESIEAQKDREERERKRQEMEAETAQIATRSARTEALHVIAYRQDLRKDPRIALLQILDMKRPLGVTDIYIRLRLHRETGQGYSFDQEGETRPDPNALLKAGHLRLEQRTSTSLTPEEALRMYKHSVVVGDPGAGKTTLLKFLALQAVEQHLVDLPDLPIHVELNAYANSGYRDLLEFAAVVWEERYGFPKTEAWDCMRMQLQKGQALLLPGLSHSKKLNNNGGGKGSRPF
jgi:hypothetical protein